METNNYNTKEYKNKLLNDFLMDFIPKEFKEYLDIDEPIYWIYRIYNIKKDKSYVGKTKDIRRRAMNYINAVLKGDASSKIVQKMIDDGIRMFTMVPLEIATSSTSAAIKERYYIDKYDCIKNGYNVYLGSANSNNHGIGRKGGNPQTIYAKVTKSKIICGLNPDKKEIIFSTGGKLFGDLIGRHKDEIKSFARRQTKADGYFIYYLNATDFNQQMNIAKLKIEKNSIYSDCNLIYPVYVYYGEYVQKYLSDRSNPEGFDVKFITQCVAPPGYKFEDIQKFIAYYSTLENSIIC